MRRFLFLALLLVCASARAAEPLQDKNFPLLSAIERSEAARRAIAADPALAAIRQAKLQAVDEAASACALDAECVNARFRITDAESAAAADALRHLCATNAAVRALADRVRASRAYERYRDRSDAELLASAWLDAARGIDHIIDVYGSGKAPRYPAIDHTPFDVKSEPFRKLIHTLVLTLRDQRSDFALFFQPSLRYALHLLELSGRDEAARHEPLDSGLNAAAKRRLASIRWRDYPYAAIVVLGYGPERAGIALAPENRLRIEVAARRFREGKAPVLIVSGGYVHPSQTPYCEAIEMKKALVRDFHIPADAIVVEPHARHTTTNLRNAARLMFRYGIPFDRMSIVTTDAEHSAYVESADFAKRCGEELGYQPAKLFGRLSPFDLEFVPQTNSLQVDAMDPLDP